MGYEQPKGWGAEKAKEFKKKAKFGDIIENHWASEENPRRKSVFIRMVRRQRTDCAQVTDMKGNVWEVFNDKDMKLEITGTVLK